MKHEPLVFEVGESGFDRYVIENSRHLPVLVEFMGIWSEPSVMMADTLAKLAKEFAGLFVFVKVDIDEQAGLRDKYQIKNVPTLIVFRDGEASFTQEGQFEEQELRVLLNGVGVFRESDALREQARAKHMAGDTPAAILLLTEAIKKDPGNTQVAMDMVQIMIDTEQLVQAKDLFNRLPATDRGTSMGKSLLGQLTFADLAVNTTGVEELTARLGKNNNDHDARFDLAICLVSRHEYEAAMDHLFSILDREPDYKAGAAREMIITINNMLVPNAPELAQRYRTRLANYLNA